VDTAESSNGVVDKMGVASGSFKVSDAISPSMSYHYDATHQRTLAEAETSH
jgi:hypothetical protein